MTTRHIVWFSCGAASAVAAMLTLSEHPHAELLYTDPGSEHPDNARFLADCERWLNTKITVLRSDEYYDTWNVWMRRRYLVGRNGTACTVHLKKRPRQQIELAHAKDAPGVALAQTFGYTAEESDRIERFRNANPDVDLRVPLMDRGLTKADCLGLIERAGIELPAMYRLGYHNANCIGCPHGGLGYWNKIRRDFPETFDRMAAMERDIGHACNKDANGPVFLDELDPQRGDYQSEPRIECSLLCVLAEVEAKP